MTATPNQSFPYRMDYHPNNVEGLGNHVDRELSKIETAIAQLADDIATIQARLTAASIP